MIEINDDAAAADIYTKIDSTTGDERQQMADALITYGEKKAKEEYNQADEHFSNLFLDDKYYAEQVNTPDLQKAYEATPFPKEAAKRSVIQGYLQHASGAPVSADTYEFIRDSYAQAKFGKTTVSDDEMFGLVRGEYDWQKQRTAAINDLQMQAVSKAITDSQLGQNRPFVDGMTEVFNQWQGKYPELVDGKNDAAFLSQGYKLYYDTINDLDTVRPQASKALSTLTSFTQGNATDEDMQSLANDFVSAPPEDRQKIYKYVTLAAQAGQIDRAGIEQFAVNMGQAFTRGFDFVPQGTLQMQEAGVNNWLESIRNGTQIWVPTDGDLTKAVVGNAPAGAESDAWRQATVPEAETLIQSGQSVRESFKVVRELRNVAKTGVDPIRPVLEEDSFWGTAERGAYGLAGSIPLMGATAVNPYLGVLAYQATEYDRIMLENPDIDPQFAQGLALVEGAANAAIDRVQLSSLSGKLPMFGRYLDRIASDGVRRTVKIGANVVEQNLQEGAQDLIAPVLETAVAALREDMPDKDFTSLMDEWAGQRAETFFATLPLSLIGGGIATYQDIKNPSAELNATRLRQVGFDKEQTTFIQRAENPEEYDARIQMEWEKRTPENIEAGRQEVIAEMQQAATPDENSAKLSETVAEDGTRRWVVTTPDGKELLQTPDQQAALDAIAQHGHAQILNKQFETLYEPQELRQMITDLSTQWTSQDSNNKLIEEEQGMNAQQELEQLQAAGNAAQIQELHNRIANSPLKDTPYEQINILGKASVDDVAEMVFGSLITINPNTRPENLREEIHHIGVRVAIKNGSVTLDTLRGWLDATEKALPGTFQNLVRDTEGDIVESLAQVQAAYENGKINADEETKLPASFIGYIKNMMRTFAEVMRRAVALRSAFKDGILPSGYETFLADSVGLNQQARVDTARERVSNEVLTDTNYSIGTNPFPMEQKGKWWANEDFAQRGGRISTMSPDQFLSQVRPLEVDDASRDNIDDLKNMMQSGRKLDPLAIYADGKEDGRHRAIAAKELGMDTLPVIDFRQPVSTDTNYSIGRSDEITGLPLNPNGTVTVYHGTTKESAAEIQQTGILKSAGEPDVYFTTAKDGTGYGDGTVVGVEIDPKQLILDDEFPDGRRDFRVNVGKSKSLAVKLSQSAPNWHSSPDEFQKHWTDRGVVNSTQIYGGGKYIKPGKIIVGEGSRNSGLGTEFMRDLTAFADSKAMQIRVTPSKDFGATSVDRLKKFYKRFGFVENSGRNKDYEISDTMYRRPSPGATNYSIGFAPNGNPSNLKPEEQALARSPEFKARLGDWEILSKQVQQKLLGENAVSTLLAQKSGEIVAMNRPGLGDITFLYGTPGKINKKGRLVGGGGLSHLIEQRNLEGNNGIAVAKMMPSVIAHGRVVERQSPETTGERVKIVYQNHTAILSRYQDGKPFSWLLTGWENEEGGAGVNPAAAYASAPSGISEQMGASIDIDPLNSQVVNPESVTVKTDENGEPLASEIARFRQETGTSSYSIASQSEIDRVNRALGGMNRGPDERLKVYERARQSFSRVMQENKEELDAIRSSVSTNTAPAIEQIEMDRAGRIADIEAEENTEVAKALQDNADTFLPRIEAAPTPAERKRAERDAKDRAKILEQGIRDKYAERKKSTDAEAKSQRDQTLQAAAAKDSAANARMRDKVRQTKLVNAIGELDGILKALPPEVRGRVGGFAVLANIGTGDKALADFFVKRIDMIDRQLERTLKEEYGNVFDALLERTKPKKAAAGEKPKGIGADIQSLFATVREARDWSAEKVDGHIANIETQIASGNLTAQEEAMLTREADLVSLVGDWKNADSSRRAAALSAATETWAKGMSTFVQKKIREREERDMARAEAISATGKKGDYVDRRKRVSEDNGLRGKIHGWFMNTISWDQAVNVLFGHESPMAIRLSDGQRKAEYTKIDAIQAKEDALHDLFTKLAGGKRVDGERLMWKMSQPSIPANGLNLSELDALAAPMMWAQEDGRRHMTGELDENGNPISKWHYDQQFIDDIESQLSPEAKAIRDFLLNNYGKEWFSINSVFREMNGINLPRIPNYSPITVAPINAPSGMVTDPVTGNAVSATSISPGALRTRGVAIAEPVFRNVVQTYLAHTRQMEHWKAFAPWIKEANGILRNRDVQNSIKEAGGEEATGVLNRYLDIFAQGGNRDASLGLEISKTMGGMFSRAAQVALVGRVGTLAIQTTQIGAASAELPVGAYLSRLGKLVTGNLGWGDAINSKYIQRRIKQMPPTVQIAMEGLKAGKPNELKHQVEKIGQLISGTDALWTAGTYAMVYDYQLGQAKALGYRGQSAEDYAHNIAERITDRLAQPTRMGTRSIYELTATNPGARLAWAFASESRKNLALLAYTKANRPLKRFLAATAGYVVFNLAMGALIRNAWKDMRDDGDDEDDFFDEKTWNWKRMGVAMLTEPLQGMPLLGDYTEKGINAALGQYHQSSDLINFERGIKSFKNIPDILQGERDAEGVLKDIDGMVSLMGLFNQNAAAAASLTHIASDFFGVVDNATTED